MTTKPKHIYSLSDLARMLDVDNETAREQLRKWNIEPFSFSTYQNEQRPNEVPARLYFTCLQLATQFPELYSVLGLPKKPKKRKRGTSNPRKLAF